MNIKQPEIAEQNSNSDLSCQLCFEAAASGKTYDIIYADPPWEYEFSPKAGSAIEKHYPTMKLEDICGLPIKDIASKDCYLFMWTTMPKLEESFKVINAWGFRYRTCAFVWIKIKKNNEASQFSFLPIDQFDEWYGNGIYVRQNVEMVLLARNGREKINLNKSDVKQIVYAPRQKHSKKPDEVRTRIIASQEDIFIPQLSFTD